MFLALCSTSASPRCSINGGTYIAKRPPKFFFRPYQPPMGFSFDRAQCSTVPSLAPCFSSVLPNSIQSPCFLSIAAKSSIHRRSQWSTVLPTVYSRMSSQSFSSTCIVYELFAGGVLRSSGLPLVQIFLCFDTTFLLANLRFPCCLPVGYESVKGFVSPY